MTRPAPIAPILSREVRQAMVWAQTHETRHILIKPDRLMQNSYIESIIGKLRDKYMNDHWFGTLAQLRTAIALAAGLRRGLAS